MSSYSSDRFIDARRALNRRSADLWENLQVSDRERFESAEAVITFCGASLGALREMFPEHLLALGHLWGETIWCEGDYSEDGMKAAIRSVLQIGEVLVPVGDLPGALGMYLINEMLRRFQDRLGFGSLDEEGYGHRQTLIDQVASTYMHAWVHIDLRIIAEEIHHGDRPEDEQLVAEHEQLVADRRARLVRAVLAKPYGHSDLHRYFLARHLEGYWARKASTGLVEALVSELRDWSYFDAEAELWEELLLRAPLENGWEEYADVLVRLGFRCASLRDAVSRSQSPTSAYRVSGLEGLADLMAVGLLGVWQFESSLALLRDTRSVMAAARAVSERLADPDLLAEALSAREVPPAEIVVQLLENEDTLAAVCALIAPLSRSASAIELLGVVSRGLPAIRLMTVHELHPLVTRSLVFPLNDALYQAISHPGAIDLTVLEQLNDVVRILCRSHPDLLSTDSDDRLGFMMGAGPTGW